MKAWIGVYTTPCIRYLKAETSQNSTKYLFASECPMWLPFLQYNSMSWGPVLDLKFLFTENSDYVGRSNVGVTFYSGDRPGSYRCTYISIREDSIVEYNEVFNVILTENSDRLVIQSGRSNTRITIIEDNDCKSIQKYVACKLHNNYYYATLWSAMSGRDHDHQFYRGCAPQAHDKIEYSQHILCMW